MAREDKEPFQFPCSYPLKVMGANTNEFYAAVSSVIEKYIDKNSDLTYHARTSSGGKYLSVTATFKAESRKQLDDIYSELNRHELVLMTL